MGVSLLETEPHKTAVYLLVVLAGSIGYLIVRRWPRAVVAAFPIAAWCAWQLLPASLGFILAVRSVPGYRKYAFFEAAILGATLLVGLGLPLLGLRHARSRPAI